MTEFMNALQEDGSIDPAILHTKRFSANGVKFDNIDGEQCIGDARNIAHTGVVILMRPSLFLAVVPKDHIRSIDYMASTPNAFGSPHLEVRFSEDGGIPPMVREHEGRSRMSAIIRHHGDVPVPVCLFLNIGGYTLRAREIEKEWIERIAAGVMEEDKEPAAVPTFVNGPIFEQAVYVGAGQELHQLDFRCDRLATLRQWG